MPTIEQAFDELRSLHERLTQAPAPEIAPRAFLPFPPGSDPVRFAIDEVERLRQLIDQRAKSQRDEPTPTAPGWMPRASLFAGDTSACFVLELPGVAKEDVNVTVARGELIVKGQRNPTTTDGLRPVYVEQSFGAFERRFPLPPWANADSVAASYAQGVLQITVARSEDAVTGPIDVKIS